MKPKKIVKMIVDIGMTLLVLILMAYHVTGRKAHEWLGAVLFCFFIFHHILNLSWIKGLFRGQYTVLRIFNTSVNILLTVAMLCMMASGIMLSGEVFSFLGLRLFSIGRPLHMASTAWGFLLMSVHLGLHWGLVAGMVRRKRAASKTEKRIGRIAAAAISLWGVYGFFTRRFWEKLFLVTQYSFFDFNAPAWLFFADYIAMMGLFACIAHFTTKQLTGKK